MELLSKEFIKRHLEMTSEERIKFYQGPIYMSLSPAEQEKFDRAVSKEQGRQIVEAFVAGLNNTPESEVY